jgi:uncharacterized protein (DUF1330 family)
LGFLTVALLILLRQNAGLRPIADNVIRQFRAEANGPGQIHLPIATAVVLLLAGSSASAVAGGTQMKAQYTMGLTLVAGIAIGAFAMQGLHAQGAKLKAYSIGEIEPIGGATVSTAYLDAARKAINNAHGRPLRTLNGRVVGIEGTVPPRAAIVEWDSVDDAVAFYKSKAWTDLAPERDKTQKTIRRYVVELEP